MEVTGWGRLYTYIISGKRELILCSEEQRIQCEKDGFCKQDKLAKASGLTRCCAYKITLPDKRKKRKKNPS